MLERMHCHHQKFEYLKGDFQKIIVASLSLLRDLVKDGKFKPVNAKSNERAMRMITKTLGDPVFCAQPFVGQYQRMTDLRDAAVGVFDTEVWEAAKPTTKRAEMEAVREAALQGADETGG